MGHRVDQTQKLANSFPEWSSIRTDEQSYGAQLINVLAHPLQDLHQQLKNLGANYYATTANVGDIDMVHRFSLPGSYAFTTLNDDPNNPIYSSLTVSGLAGTTWHNVVQVSGNNIESFWYDSIPNRVICSGFPVNNTFLDDTGVTIYGGIIQGHEANSPLTAVSGVDLDLPHTKLWVEVVSGVQFLDINDQGDGTRGSVTLTGTTRKGTKESETIIFIHNEIQTTAKEWKNIERVDIKDIREDTAKVRVFAHRFGRNHSPQIPPPQDFYNLAVAPGSKQDLDTFWDVGVNTISAPVLKTITWEMDDIRARVDGLLGKYVTRSTELLDTVGSPIAAPVDLALQPFSNRVWVVTASSLYLYDTNLYLASTRELDKKDFDAMSVIEPETYHVTRGESVKVSYVWRRPITDIIKHRVYVYAPDGTGYSIVNGSMITLDLPNTWVYGTPEARQIRNVDTFALSQRGDWIFTMDVTYKNGVTETDQRIVSVDHKTAMVAFPLTTCIAGSTIEGIDFDSDQYLWVLINTSGTRSKLRITQYKDVMMVDYERKTIFFHEPYDQIRVVS